ncbi:MAG: hypothetical protein MZV70_40635 [Desulfobacterales bacterium]|nr:hypothetical protein [Desulfobacterales bacterium]
MLNPMLMGACVVMLDALQHRRASSRAIETEKITYVVRRPASLSRHAPSGRGGQFRRRVP